MNKFITMTAAIVISAAIIEAHALPPEHCSNFHLLGETVMSGRQAGVAAKDMADKVADKDPIFLEIIIEAYRRPRYTLPEFQQQSVEDFANFVYLTCLEID